MEKNANFRIVLSDYTWESGSLYSSLYYRLIRDPYMRIFSIDDSNPDYDIVNRIYENTGSATNSGLELLLSQDITANWKASGTLNWYSNHIDAYEGKLFFPYERPFSIHKSTANAWNLKISTEISLPSESAVHLTGVYYSDRILPKGKNLPVLR